MSKAHLDIFQKSDLNQYVFRRDGETKIGEALRVEGDADFKKLASLRVKYAILGIPEDIGPRANMGRKGAGGAWQAFLSSFLNVQSNEFFDPTNAAIIGSVDVKDLMNEAASLDNKNPDDLKKLRDLCARIDERVAPIVKQLVAAGLTPIVIGGGHNNAYPIIRGTSEANGKPIACINCDPHADFRAIEGRHSGNPFSYAHEDDLLKAYFVLGLHENYNSDPLLKKMSDAGFKFETFEDIYIRRRMTLEGTIDKGLKYISKAKLPTGLELDMDSIAFMPSSAESPVGISNEDASFFIHSTASRIETAYLHISEGAPSLHNDEGDRRIGKSIAMHVMTYMKSDKARADKKL